MPTNYFANYANALKSGMVPSAPLFSAPTSSSTTSTSSTSSSSSSTSTSSASKPSTSSTSSTSTTSSASSTSPTPSTSTIYNAQGQPTTTAGSWTATAAKQQELNTQLEKAKQDWWDARFANDQAKMDEAAKRGEGLRSQGALETEAAKKQDADNLAKLQSMQGSSTTAGNTGSAGGSNGNTGTTGTAGSTNGVKLSAAEQAKLDQQLLDAKRKWWEARLTDNQALMDKYSKEGADLRAKGALESKEAKQLDIDFNKKLAGKLDNESKLLESKKAWWQAYANMDTNAMNAANKTAEALRASPYVNDHTDAMVLLDKQNASFIANKKAYYEARIGLDAAAMNKAMSGMQDAVKQGASLSGSSYKIDAVNNSIIDGVVEWASLTLKRSPEHAADALKAAKALYSQSNFQGALANIDSSKLAQVVQQIQVADVRYWNEVSGSTSAQPGNKAEEEAARNQLYKQLDAVGLKVDYKNSYLNTVNNEIKTAKDLYWSYLDLAKTTADAADPNDYAVLAAQQQAIYTSIQNKVPKDVLGVLKTTAVDTLNNNFYTARNQLNEYLKTGKYDEAINALEYLQGLKDQGATLNIRRNSSVTQAQADDFLYELKRREWDRKQQLEAPDKNLEKYKVIAKNVLGANGSAEKIVNLDKWNEINLKAKADFWRGAGMMDKNLMQTASVTLNSTDMKKYSTLSSGFDTKLDEINADRIRLAVNDKVYRGNSVAESILETEYDQMDRDVEKAKKAGMGSYVLSASDLSVLDRTMETLYGQKKSLWDIKASGSQPAAQLEASVNKQLSDVNTLFSKLNERRGGDRFTIPAFSMDTANQQVLNLRQQLRTAVYDADSDKAWSIYDRALGFLDQGATLDIGELEPNLASTDWGQIRIDKMFRDTINHLNSVSSKEDITKMQTNMKKLGFYTGEVTGSYNRDFLTGYGMYQHIIANNSPYPGRGFDVTVANGEITSHWLQVAKNDESLGRKVEWAKIVDDTASWSFKSAFTAVGVADGVVSQLMKDGVDTLNFVASINVTSPKFYTQTIPAIYSIGKSVATGQITWDDIKDTFSESVRAQLYTPFKEIKDNYNKVFSGTASYAEAQEFGRNVAIALEAVSVVLGIGASTKAAQLTSKLSSAAGSVFKSVAGSGAVGEGLEWITRFTKEAAEKIRVSLEWKFGKGAGKFNDPVITKTNKGLEVEFTNPAGNHIKWVEQNPKNIPIAIESAKNSLNPGKAIEGKVGDYVQKKINVIGFGLKLEDVTNKKIAGDIDVLTNKQIIEVKKSFSALDMKQIDKYTNPQNPLFFNYDGKEVIVYIDEALDMSNSNVINTIRELKAKNVTVVNSLDELGEVLK